MFIQKVFKSYYSPKMFSITRYSQVFVKQNPSDILKEQKPKKKRVSSPRQPHKDVYTFFEDNKLLDIYNFFPKNLLNKKFRAPEHFYVTHPEAAEIIAKHLHKHCNDDRPMIEINPGPGILTEKLLKTNIQDIRLYEINDVFIPHLTKKFTEEIHSDRIQIKSGDFIGIWKLAYQDKFDNKNRIDDFLCGMQFKEWNDINYRIFGCTGSLSFFKHLINSTVSQNSLMSYGRCELFMAMTPALYIHLTCNNDAGYMMYRSTSILFQIMFEHHFLTKIPKTHFLPWLSSKKKNVTTKLGQFNSIDSDYVYLVRIVPRKNLFQFCCPEDIQSLWFFIKQHCNSRKNKIIPTLEKWIPGCGQFLIMNTEQSEPIEHLNPNAAQLQLPPLSKPSTTMSTKDYFDDITIYTEFGDLSPSQLLTLFYQFKNLPGYKNSSFVTCMDNNILKIDSSTNVDGIEIPEEADDDDNEPIISEKEDLSDK